MDWDTEGNGSSSHTSPEIGVSNHIVKVIEVLAESPHSWEDAARVALREASRSLRNIASIYVKDFQAIVSDGQVRAYRVNAKVSFVVNAQSQLESNLELTGGGTMRYRNRGQGQDPRRREEFPEYDDYGLHGDDRRQYRGRESYEQQARGGEGGRSGMWDQRYLPREYYDDPYRNNASEDRRGYQNIGQRQEFESGGRGRPDYYLRWRSDPRDDEPRYGFDAQDYGSGYRDRDVRDYGGGYRDRDVRGRWEGEGYRDDYSRTDYGDRNYRADSAERSSRDNRDYGAARGYGQGRYATTQYDAQSRQAQRRTFRGPKGYKRSDDRIREDVCDRLSDQYDVDATEVEVSVSNGEVTLTGTVSDRDQKFRVEHIADGVGGVSEVHNQLRVRRESGAQAAAQTAPAARQQPPSNQRHS